MKKVVLTIIALLVLTAPAFAAGGLMFKGDDQQLHVENTAGSSHVTIKADGTLDVNGESLSASRLQGFDTSIGSIETRIGVEAVRIDSIEVSIDNIITNSLTGKMDLVSPRTAENLLKVDSNGQAVDAGFAESNVFLRDASRDMQGDLNMASHKMINLSSGTDANDAATYGQLQSAIAGLSWRQPVKEIQYNSASVSGPVVAGYRVLVAGGETAGDFAGHTNEVAVRNATNDAWTFESPSDGWALFNLALDQGWTYNAALTIWVPFSGADSLAVGNALSKTGNILDVKYNDTTIGLNGSNQLEIKALSIADAQISGSAAIAESKLALTYGTQALYTLIDNHTSEATIHRSIDDNATTNVALWSALKIDTELGLKSNVGHTHTSASITDFTSSVRGAVSGSGLITYTSLTGVFSLSNSDIDHNSLNNYASDEHNKLNDALESASSLWSSTKTSSEIVAMGATKANLVHTHTMSDITDLNVGASVDAWLASTSQVILSLGKSVNFVGEKINITEGSAVTFANINVGTFAWANVEVTASAFGSTGKAVDAGKWTMVIRKSATGSVAISSIQQVYLYNGGSANAAELDIALADVTATATDSDTVALKCNADLTGTDSITEYGFTYDIKIIGQGTASVVAQ